MKTGMDLRFYAREGRPAVACGRSVRHTQHAAERLRKQLSERIVQTSRQVDKSLRRGEEWLM